MPGGQALPKSDLPKSDLKVRAIAGLVMGAAALALLWLGGLPFLVMTLIIGALVLREWCTITQAGTQAGQPRAIYLIALTVLAAGFGLAGAARWPLAFGLACGGGALLWGLGLALRQRTLRWVGPGLIYAAAPALALAWLRQLPEGFVIVLWLMVAVVMTDTCAYFAGRRFGGPKLAPRISPKKTWSGLIGGVSGAALSGWVIGALMGLPLAAAGWLAGGAAVLAVVSQMGDLGESALKRAFGVKDSGSILPGHGGIMDRVDGLAAAAPVVALAEVFRLGVGNLL